SSGEWAASSTSANVSVQPASTVTLRSPPACRSPPSSSRVVTRTTTCWSSASWPGWSSTNFVIIASRVLNFIFGKLLLSGILQAIVGFLQPTLGGPQLVDLSAGVRKHTPELHQLGLERTRARPHRVIDRSRYPIRVSIALQPPQLLGFGVALDRQLLELLADASDVAVQLRALGLAFVCRREEVGQAADLTPEPSPRARP